MTVEHLELFERALDLFLYGVLEDDIIIIIVGDFNLSEYVFGEQSSLTPGLKYLEDLINFYNLEQYCCFATRKDIFLDLCFRIIS